MLSSYTTTNTTTTVLQLFVQDYPGELVPEETFTHSSVLIIVRPLSASSSVFNLRAWQSFCTTSLHVLFGLPLGLEPSTSYSMHFFTQSLSSFRNTCPYHHSLFCSVPRLYYLFLISLSSSLGTLSFGLKVICNGFSQNWWKVVSSCLLQYKPVCVINFDKLRCKMLKSKRLVVFLYSYSSARRHAWRHIRMCLFLFALLLRLDKKVILPVFTTEISQRMIKMLHLGLQS